MRLNHLGVHMQAVQDGEAADLDCCSPAAAGQLPSSHWCASPKLPRVELPRPGSARHARAGSAAASPTPASGWRHGADAVPDCRLEPVLEPGAVAHPAARLPPPAERGQTLSRVVPTLTRACARARSAECLSLRAPANLQPRAASTEWTGVAGYMTGAPGAHAWQGSSGFGAAPSDFTGAAGVCAGAAGERGGQGSLGFRAAPRGVCASALAAVAMPLGAAPGGISVRGAIKAGAHEAEPVALGSGGWQQRMRWPSLSAGPAAPPAWCDASSTAAPARGACAPAWRSPGGSAGQGRGSSAGHGPGHAAGSRAFQAQDPMEADDAPLTAFCGGLGARSLASAAQAGGGHAPVAGGGMARAAHAHGKAGALACQPDGPDAENCPAAANRISPGGHQSPNAGRAPGLPGFGKGMCAGGAEQMRLRAAAAAAAAAACAAARPNPCADAAGAHTAPC